MQYRTCRILVRHLSGKRGDLSGSTQYSVPLQRMITSFVIHYLDWQAGNNFGSFAPYSDYPLTGLLPRNTPDGISRP
jgi:hypothetical protein